jgi:microcompartment protein CcmK/EutM
MLLGKVVGTLVATRKDEKLLGFKFLVVKQLNIENEETGGYVIAADAVQAGLGDVVLYATGSSARAYGGGRYLGSGWQGQVPEGIMVRTHE